jgi:hypothetical protein
MSASSRGEETETDSPIGPATACSSRARESPETSKTVTMYAVIRRGVNHWLRRFDELPGAVFRAVNSRTEKFIMSSNRADLACC